MRIRKIIFILFLASVTLGIAAQEQTSESADTLFRRALGGDSSFDRAIETWAEEIQGSAVPAAALYYNMANALALEGRQDEALVLYGRALSIKPGNQDFRYNRNIILKDKELVSQSWSAPEGILWFPLWLVGERGMWIIMAAAALGGLIYTLTAFFRKRIPSLTWVSISVIFLIYGAIVLGSWEYRSSGLAVVRGEELQLFEGDSPLYPSAFTLNGGEELRILEERAGWLRVRSTAGNGEGWCEKFTVLRAEEVIDSY